MRFFFLFTISLVILSVSYLVYRQELISNLFTCYEKTGIIFDSDSGIVQKAIRSGNVKVCNERKEYIEDAVKCFEVMDYADITSYEFSLLLIHSYNQSIFDLSTFALHFQNDA